MAIVERTSIVSSNFGIRGNGWAKLAYAAVAVIAIVASIYLASNGPGMSDGDLAVAAVMP